MPCHYGLCYLIKDSEEGLTSKEQEEWRKLAPMVYGDLPDDYTICERDIKFEDEL